MYKRIDIDRKNRRCSISDETKSGIINNSYTYIDPELQRGRRVFWIAIGSFFAVAMTVVLFASLCAIIHYPLSIIN